MKSPVIPNKKFEKRLGQLSAVAAFPAIILILPFWWSLLCFSPFLFLLCYKAYHGFKQNCVMYGCLMILAICVIVAILAMTQQFIHG